MEASNIVLSLSDEIWSGLFPQGVEVPVKSLDNLKYSVRKLQNKSKVLLESETLSKKLSLDNQKDVKLYNLLIENSSLFSTPSSSFLLSIVLKKYGLNLNDDDFVASVRWHFMVHEVSISFIQTALMPSYVAHLKKLSGLAHSANTNRLFLPFHKGGLGLPHLVHLYQECQLQRVLILKYSYDQTILNLVKIRESKEMMKSKSWNPYKVALEYSKRLDESKNNQLSKTASRSLMVGWLKETNVKLLENQLSSLISQGEAARAHFNEGKELMNGYQC
ncbi:hypothetical protein RCL1_006645 [Eukaryota sp. TZLM3-RCL]